MENCKFKVFNYKYGKYLPCDIIRKLDNKIWKICAYVQEKDGSIKIIETCTFVDFIKNNE
jgi:hypothetical protein